MILWKRVQIFASYKKLSGSILCVIFKKLNGSIHKKINSVGRIFKKISIVWVGFTKVQFCEFFFFIDEKTESWKKKVHFFESKFFQKSSSQFFESCEKGPSIWIMKKKKEQLILWVKLSKKRKFNSLRHIFNKKSIVWVISKKGSIFSILWVFFQKKSSIL